MRSSGTRRRGATTRLAQQSFENLAGRGSWQGLNLSEVLRHLELGQPFPTELREFLWRELFTWSHDDVGMGYFSPGFVWVPDDCGFEDARMFVEDTLPLRGGTVLPTRNDHVLLAVLDVQEAVAVQPPHIARAEPSVLEA